MKNSMRVSWFGKGFIALGLLLLGGALPAQSLAEAWSNHDQADGAWYCAYKRDSSGPGMFQLERWGDDCLLPNHDVSLLSVGSLGKVLVALGVLRLAQDELLDLNAPLRSYLPEPYWPDNPWEDETPLTALHLLEHSSGFDDTHFSEYFYPADLAPQDRDFSAFLARSPATHCRWRPGTAPSYSNLNYALLAQLISEVSGRPWDQYLLEAVQRPLDAYGIFDRSRITDCSPPEFIYAPAYNYSPLLLDLSYLLAAFDPATGLLDSTHLAFLFHSHTLSAPRSDLVPAFTSGLQRGARGQETYFYATGEVPGWTSRLEWYPDQQRGFAVVYHQLRNYPSAETPLTQAIRQQVIAPRRKRLGDVPAPYPGAFPTEFAGCYARANPRNALLGWYDNWTQVIRMDAADGDLIQLGGKYFIRTAPGQLSNMMDRPVRAVYGESEDGNRYVQVGMQYYEACNCARPTVFRGLRYGGLAIGGLFLLLVLARRVVPSYQPSSREWLIVPFLTLFGAAEAAFALFLREPFLHWTEASGSAYLILLLTSLIPLLYLGQLAFTASTFRRAGGGFLKIALVVMGIWNGLLVYGMAVNDLWFLSLWKW